MVWVSAEAIVMETLVCGAERDGTDGRDHGEYPKSVLETMKALVINRCVGKKRSMFCRLTWSTKQPSHTTFPHLSTLCIHVECLGGGPRARRRASEQDHRRL